MKLAELLAAAAGGSAVDWQKVVDQIGTTVATQISNLNSRWTLYQAAIMIVAWLLAKGATVLIDRRLDAGLRQIKGQRGLLRVLLILTKRIDWFMFSAILGVAGAIVLHSTWPSNAYLLRLAAQLMFALALVSTISRLIRNRVLQSIFTFTGWTVAGLSVFGLLGPTLDLLEETSFSIGTSHLSLLLMLKSGVLLVILVWLANVASDFLERRVADGLELSPAMRVLSGKLIRWGLLAVAVVTALRSVGVDLTAFAVFSGAIGIGVGLGLQKLASNLISGIIILSDRSIKPGDTISLGDVKGTISSLHARYVSVQTLQGAELLVPNELFVTETVVNWSYSNRRMLLEVPFGISYDSDPVKARDLAIGVARRSVRVLASPPPRCQFRAFGDSSLDLALLFWIEDPEHGIGNVKSEVMFGLWAAFKEGGIDIPFPHRELIIKSPAGAASAAVPLGSASGTGDREPQARASLQARPGTGFGQMS